VFSDGVNKTAGFQMPALLPTGVDNMMAIARANRLIVLLSGVHVYVFGATTANLNPETWQTIRRSGAPITAPPVHSWRSTRQRWLSLENRAKAVQDAMICAQNCARTASKRGHSGANGNQVQKRKRA